MARLTVQDLERAREVLVKERKYIHYEYHDNVGGRNCFCTLGAIAKVKGFCKQEADGRMSYFGGQAEDLLRATLPEDCQKDVDVLSECEARINKSQALKIVDRFIAALRRK